MNQLLADAIAIPTIAELSTLAVTSNDLNSNYNSMLILLGGAVVMIIAGILILPRFFDKVLNLGPILGIIALVGAAVALPYSVYLAVTPTNPSASADVELTISNIKFELENQILVLSWETSSPSLGSIRYGTQANQLDQVVFTEEPLKRKTTHKAFIPELIPGSKYYFEIVIGNNKYRQGGKPLEFEMPK